MESASKMSKRKMLFVQLLERRITFNRQILNRGCLLGGSVCNVNTIYDDVSTEII